MKKILSYSKFILQIFFFICIINNTQAKNSDKLYKSDKISSYFSGIISLYDNDYANSYKYLKELEGLEKNHLSFSKNYQYSLINSERFKEAFNYSKKLEKQKIDVFESNLIIGTYYLKNKKYDKALEYFKKLESNKQATVSQNILSTTLTNWLSFIRLKENEAANIIENIPDRFSSLRRIQKTFLYCYYNSNLANQNFIDLASDKKTDFSRYNFFYANYLHNQGDTKAAYEFIHSITEEFPTNLILNQLREDLKLKKNNFSNQFSCNELSHIIAEFFYITANALSTSSLYQLSNFYLNLAKYLNPNFISYNALYAENLYIKNNLGEAIKIYKKIKKSGSVYSWHASKQVTRILKKQDKRKDSIRNLKNDFKKILNPSVYTIHDYADFLKGNEQFEESIIYYDKILNYIDENNSLYPIALDGRGIAHERTNSWDKAEKDFLNSLRVSPNQAYVINYLAYSWIEQGKNIEKSLAMLKKANELKKNDGYIIDSLGWAFFKLGEYQKAKTYLQLAVMIMPSDPIVNDHYGDSLWMNKEKIQARYYWNYVLNLEKTEKNLIEKVKKKLIFGPKFNL